MESHQLLKEVFDKISPKQISDDMGLSSSMIYKWAQPQGESASGTANPLDRIEALLKCTKDPRIVQWICQRAGGFFITNPATAQPQPYYLIPATNEIIQEFADMLAEIASAAADNEISEKEAKNIRARWEELKSVTECFVSCCEAGTFSKIPEQLAALKKK